MYEYGKWNIAIYKIQSSCILISDVTVDMNKYFT